MGLGGQQAAWVRRPARWSLGSSTFCQLGGRPGRPRHSVVVVQRTAQDRERRGQQRLQLAVAVLGQHVLDEAAALLARAALIAGFHTGSGTAWRPSRRRPARAATATASGSCPACRAKRGSLHQAGGLRRPTWSALASWPFSAASNSASSGMVPSRKYDRREASAQRVHRHHLAGGAGRHRLVQVEELRRLQQRGRPPARCRRRSRRPRRSTFSRRATLGGGQRPAVGAAAEALDEAARAGGVARPGVAGHQRRPGSRPPSWPGASAASA